MEILRQGAARLGLHLGPHQLERFQLFYQELASWNERQNLTAITGYADVQTRHFLDSLTCLLAFPPYGAAAEIPDTVPLQRPGRAVRCIDIGTGAGFPGLPLRILLPDLQLTLLESIGKKVTWLQHIVRLLQLDPVEIVQGRAEELGQNPAYRETFDLAVARAVAPLNVLAEYCLPLVRPGGRMIALKGEDAVTEVQAAAEAIAQLGGELIAVKPMPGDMLPDGHHLVVIAKVAATPERFPRRTGIPSKRPLG
ncbi:MAG: 16S rRNA (guanine(527)-N(7))-methyltransferase RsmG [Anaerolineae bacterium]|jgi:16S rRNA (guanine527-N7)-methyltransferase|nr:16S rRNA (guanine(527)-N(7))-methyltransferase RsmG [Chloroflexota bacterium]